MPAHINGSQIWGGGRSPGPGEGLLQFNVHCPVCSHRMTSRRRTIPSTRGSERATTISQRWVHQSLVAFPSLWLPVDPTSPSSPPSVIHPVVLSQCAPCWRGRGAAGEQGALHGNAAARQIWGELLNWEDAQQGERRAEPEGTGLCIYFRFFSAILEEFTHYSWQAGFSMEAKKGLHILIFKAT